MSGGRRPALPRALAAARGGRPQGAGRAAQPPGRLGIPRGGPSERGSFPYPSPRVRAALGSEAPGCYRFSRLRLSILLANRQGPSAGAQRRGLRDSGTRAAASGSPRARPARRRAGRGVSMETRRAPPRSTPEATSAQPQRERAAGRRGATRGDAGRAPAAEGKPGPFILRETVDSRKVPLEGEVLTTSSLTFRLLSK
ncbi:translation initiation factor IF-2-like isoform X2 [Sciurus carolinensis]|uniref:translation initiation factor IF-2-like isoform X2 n=1 Tax=Sciurus carolinensis TaxID=30640 RepID=UPI001FB40267|nr:translation initiation factor IF-2-like isoform X2 [Sciurus carolinensis]